MRTLGDTASEFFPTSRTGLATLGGMRLRSTTQSMVSRMPRAGRPPELGGETQAFRIRQQFPTYRPAATPDESMSTAPEPFPDADSAGELDFTKAPSRAGLGRITAPSDEDVDRAIGWWAESGFREPLRVPGLTREAFTSGLTRWQSSLPRGEPITDFAEGPNAPDPTAALTDTAEGMATAQGLAGRAGAVGATVAKAGLNLLGLSPLAAIVTPAKTALRLAVKNEAQRQTLDQQEAVTPHVDPALTAAMIAASPYGGLNTPAGRAAAQASLPQGLALGPNNNITTNFGARGGDDPDAPGPNSDDAPGPGQVGLGLGLGAQGQGPDSSGPSSPTGNVTGTTADAAPNANDATEGGPGQGAGGGAGAGAAGCFLASWTLDRLPAAEADRGRRFFADFYDLFMGAYPQEGRRLFATCQAVARRILAKVDALPPDAQREVERFIYARLVQPTGARLDAGELDDAVTNLVKVVTALARRFDVPLPKVAGVTIPDAPANSRRSGLARLGRRAGTTRHAMAEHDDDLMPMGGGLDRLSARWEHA